MIQTWKILHQHDDVCEKKNLVYEVKFIFIKPGDEESKPGHKKKLFSIRVVKGWNQLSEAVKGSMTLYAFKNNYEKHKIASIDPD